MNHAKLEANKPVVHEQIIKDFASRGFIILKPEQLGLDAAVHKRVYEQEKAAYHAERPVTPASIPDVLEVLRSPGLVAVCNQLVGENWAIVPFTHNASFTSGARDQHWHKDDNGPYNARKQRHHQAVQIEMLYFPQDVKEDMGPTAVIPYSQYWTFNHEENHDNFAGADHLDFDYVISGLERVPVSGPDTSYDLEDVKHARTAHDKRMREAVTNTGWPLVEQFQAAPLEAGSVLIYSHNTFHRGNHRRDDWRNWRENPRFMWRFWLYRTTDPEFNGSVDDVAWQEQGRDPLTGINFTDVPDDVSVVWRYHHHWLKTGKAPQARASTINLKASELKQEALQLYEQLHAKHERAEPKRIGAAYKLASIADSALASQLLGQALYDDRESVRRAATYGLIALGPEATETLLQAAHSSIKWVRKAGVYGLGDASQLNKDVLQALVTRLNEDPSVYIRSVAAVSLGCLGRRALATGVGVELVPECLSALVTRLASESNRVAMDLAQGRSIKFVRPTDDSDVCEGNGIDFGQARFKKVRSAVRENILWSVVILCSHGENVLGAALKPTVEALETIIVQDDNVFSVGLAMDALTRITKLGRKETPSDTVNALERKLTDILAKSPVHCFEALAVVPGGIDLALRASSIKRDERL